MFKLSTIIFWFGWLILFIGFKVNHYSLYFIGIGFVLMLIGASLFYYDKKLAKDKYDKTTSQWKNKLIQDGIKLEVDFNDCQLKTNEYKEEVIDIGYLVPNKYKALDELTGKDNRVYKNVRQVIIIFNQDIRGKKHSFESPIINKDETTLQFLLLNKKKTNIYVDKNNYDNYFIDLDFLEET